MTIYEIAKRATTEGAQELRHRGGNQYDCKLDMWQGNNRHWVLLDTFTASAIVQIYENIKPENQEKYINLPLRKLLDVTWKIASKSKEV